MECGFSSPQWCSSHSHLIWSVWLCSWAGCSCQAPCTQHSHCFPSEGTQRSLCSGASRHVVPTTIPWLFYQALPGDCHHLTWPWLITHLYYLNLSVKKTMGEWKKMQHCDYTYARGLKCATSTATRWSWWGKLTQDRAASRRHCDSDSAALVQLLAAHLCLYRRVHALLHWEWIVSLHVIYGISWLLM